MMLKLGVSACLLGRKCNYDGGDQYLDFIASLEDIDEIELFPYCPEFMYLGAPRPNMRIVGGEGRDVLAGKAKVIDEKDQDVTPTVVQAARDFHNYLVENDVKAVILADGSPSCGSEQIANDQNWPSGGMKPGMGVSAAYIQDQGIEILNSFDERGIRELVEKYLPGQMDDL